MTLLNQATCHRLQKLPQTANVWEGDRLPIGNKIAESLLVHHSNDEECILWVDGSEGLIRSIDSVSTASGLESMVRTLIKAMENPSGFAKPSRPQKIVVRSREAQFFLRGVLQDLNIKVEYETTLPMIDGLLHEFQSFLHNQTPAIPPHYATALEEVAAEVWKVAPWQSIEEHEILGIEINQWGIQTLYISILGMLGIERGILLYRTKESLGTFRKRIFADDSHDNIQEAFLLQDCYFLMFESEHADDGNEREDYSQFSPCYGSIHPLEGLSQVLYQEDASVVLVALQALCRFIRQNQKTFNQGVFPPITSRYNLPDPEKTLEPTKSPLNLAKNLNNRKVADRNQKTTRSHKKQSTLPVIISTLPELTEELAELIPDDDSDSPLETEIMFGEIIPLNSLLSLGMLPWNLVNDLCNKMGKTTLEPTLQDNCDGLPAFLIQTSLPKAKQLIQDIHSAGGISAISFYCPDEPSPDLPEFGIFITEDGHFHLIGRFSRIDTNHQNARIKWNERCQKTGGSCGLVIAKGVTGSNRGRPDVNDLIYLFETDYISPDQLDEDNLNR